MKRIIKVNLSENSYPIIIGNSLLTDLAKIFDKYRLVKNILVVIDANVMKYHTQIIYEAFSKCEGKINYYLLKPGEKSKSYRELNKIYSFLLSNDYGRDTVIFAIGGGVTGDLAGYAASSFMRGVQLVHIPTTLLAAVDSSIGGKTGINFDNKKNMIGAFYQPKLVIVDTGFYDTLPKEEKISGMGEIIKYAYLSGKEFYDYLLKNFNLLLNSKTKALEKVIFESAAIKAAVVSQDEKEIGLRKILNLGHTFGHAFESGLNFKIKHGQAVTAGIISALYLSHQIGIITGERLEDYLKLPAMIKLPAKVTGLKLVDIYSIMLHDKKNREGKIKFVLIAGTGKIIPDIEATKDKVYESLQKTFEFISSNQQ